MFSRSLECTVHKRPALLSEVFFFFFGRSTKRYSRAAEPVGMLLAFGCPRLLTRWGTQIDMLTL